MVAEHDFLFYGEIKLRGVAIMAIHNAERIERLFAGLLFGEEIVAPGLSAKIDDRFKTFIAAYSTRQDGTPKLHIVAQLMFS